MKKTVLYILIFINLLAGAQKLNLLPDTVGICRGESTVLEARNPAVPKNASYQWTSASSIIQHTDNLKVSAEGKYYVKVSAGKNVYTDSCVVKFYPRPRPLFNDTVICGSSVAVIGAKNTDYRFTWFNDETAPRIRIESPGKYWVKINNKGCTLIDTFSVSFFQGAVPNFGPEATFCLSDEKKVLSVKPSPGTRVTWSTGATSYSISPGQKGIYWVKTENKTCGARIDSVNVTLKACDCEILVPNSFTPNEDERNDYFFPVLQCEYSYYSLTIFDRWNNTVFYTNNPNGKWDGRFKGNLCPDDIYVYRIETIEKGSDRKSVSKGQISLFR